VSRLDKPTAWLGMSDSNSRIRARAMYLRYRDNYCWLGQKLQQRPIAFELRPGMRSWCYLGSISADAADGF
jgi:hypothetical protein